MILPVADGARVLVAVGDARCGSEGCSRSGGDIGCVRVGRERICEGTGVTPLRDGGEGMLGPEAAPACVSVSVCALVARIDRSDCVFCSTDACASTPRACESACAAGGASDCVLACVDCTGMSMAVALLGAIWT